MVLDEKYILHVLGATRRTFYIPLSQLPDGLKETLIAAYLSMRAIDELEDHPTLSIKDKVHFLQKLAS